MKAVVKALSLCATTAAILAATSVLAQDRLPARSAASEAEALKRSRQAVTEICYPAVLEDKSFEDLIMTAGAVRDRNPLRRLSGDNSYPAEAWHWSDSPRVLVFWDAARKECTVAALEGDRAVTTSLFSEIVEQRGGQLVSFTTGAASSQGVRDLPMVLYAVQDARLASSSRMTAFTQRNTGPAVIFSISKAEPNGF
ncbi:MAG: hypothetical protein A2795_03760 [Caulobacterales bacterium RIFCSPHIGHO2_01_FULL_67_30]|nr:MAG: hypothetical protein A2795_03760 [Caulobacterales bacterium RIFCSPHIGHO2_01_FULL_67_30]